MTLNIPDDVRLRGLIAGKAGNSELVFVDSIGVGTFDDAPCLHVLKNRRASGGTELNLKLGTFAPSSFKKGGEHFEITPELLETESHTSGPNSFERHPFSTPRLVALCTLCVALNSKLF
jgi:hypothetical protein